MQALVLSGFRYFITNMLYFPTLISIIEAILVPVFLAVAFVIVAERKTMANLILFFLGPVITLIFSLLGYAVVPYGPGLAIWDFNLGILYILAVCSLYGILLAGWSANSKYAFLGNILSLDLTRFTLVYCSRLIFNSLKFRLLILFIIYSLEYYGLLDMNILSRFILFSLIGFYIYKVLTRSPKMFLRQYVVNLGLSFIIVKIFLLIISPQLILQKNKGR